MESKINYEKIIAIALIAVLATAIVSTSALTTFSEEEDDEEKSGKSDKSGSEDEQNEEDDKEEGTETKTEETEIEVKGKIIGDSTQAKVKIEFTSTTTDKESLLEEIIDKIRLDRDTVSNLLKVETEEEEEELKEELEVEVEIKKDKAEVDFEFRFIVGSTDRDDIIDAIVDKLAGLSLTLDDVKLKVEEAEEEEAKGKERAEKAKPERIAEKARAATQGDPQATEVVTKAEKYLGKSDKAVAVAKLSLESEAIDAFGSAQLVLLKLGDRPTMLRVVINVIGSEPQNLLVAFLVSGETATNLGELTVESIDAELGLVTAHLRANIEDASLTIPGVQIVVVDTQDASSEQPNMKEAVLSGSI